MIKRFIFMVLIWFATSLGWMILSGTVEYRTQHSDKTLKAKVGNLWGKAQIQHPPQIQWSNEILEEKEELRNDLEKGHTVRYIKKVPKLLTGVTPIGESQIKVGVDLEHRRKGLLWYSTYTVNFEGIYQFENAYAESRDFNVIFPLPCAEGIYDNFQCFFNDKEVPLNINGGRLSFTKTLDAGETGYLRIRYSSFGQDSWIYSFKTDEGVGNVKRFHLALNSNFNDIDFPDGTMSPTSRTRTEGGWNLTWQYDSLMSGTGIGLLMPQKLNPGPFVTRVTQFAPVCLLFFFFILFIVCLLKKLPLRVEHFFFLACAFFAFHLLFAYLVDHLNVHCSFILSSIVSVFLVTSYLRLVAGPRFAFFEAGLSQMIYLVLFSYSFFYEGYTGLIVTIGSIITLFLVMQMTARHDLSQEVAFVRNGSSDGLSPKGEDP